MLKQRFDLLDEYTTICVPVRMQKGLPQSFADGRDKQLMRAGYLLVATIGWVFRAIAAFVWRIVRLLKNPRVVSAELQGRSTR
jgi:hypothetical protein